MATVVTKAVSMKINHLIAPGEREEKATSRMFKYRSISDGDVCLIGCKKISPIVIIILNLNVRSSYSKTTVDSAPSESLTRVMYTRYTAYYIKAKYICGTLCLRSSIVMNVYNSLAGLNLILLEQLVALYDPCATAN